MKTKLFIAAGIANFLGAGGALLTDNKVIQIYPEVFSRFGMIAIILWGMAYIAVSKDYEKVRWLILVFFIEKLAYVVSWIYWWMHNYGRASEIYHDSLGAWFFLIAYGIIDGAFGVFFLWVHLSLGRNRQV